MRGGIEGDIELTLRTTTAAGASSRSCKGRRSTGHVSECERAVLRQAEQKTCAQGVWTGTREPGSQRRGEEEVSSSSHPAVAPGSAQQQTPTHLVR